MSIRLDETSEWLEADGLGGFASGTLTGVRTRRYHALLLPATTPPTGRFVLVNGFDAWVETPAGRVALTTQRYGPDVVHPDGSSRITSFEPDPWPSWTYHIEGVGDVEFEIFARHGTSLVALRWRLRSSGSEAKNDDDGATARLIVRPFLSGRDIHSTHHENPVFRFDARIEAGRVEWQPYDDLPRIVASHNGTYTQEPVWYRNFLYAEEQARGLDCIEDLASPGTFEFELGRSDAILLLEATTGSGTVDGPVVSWFGRASAAEKRRRAGFASRIHRSADAYIVRRGEGSTIVAGYPWFSDWGRDTFIALRGLCIAGGRLREAKQILLQWAGAVSEGMLPNLFVEHGDQPEFNSVDAALWYVIAVHEFLDAIGNDRRRLLVRERTALHAAVLAILRGYAAGTRHAIHAAEDGLLAAGEPGVQLTWMDAKVGDWVVTPRIGKPVEINALWLNALAIGATIDPVWNPLLEKARCAFASRFWNADAGCLYDVVDVDHVPGTVDATFRPNQILTIGGLPMALFGGGQARSIVDAVEARLLTPVGLRSLAPGSPDYRPRYQGGVLERDGAYHQGTVWPWLTGAFVEAWVRVRGGTREAWTEAKRRFVEPLIEHLDGAGIGHVSEIADAESPFTPRGCPFQAWSLGELLRLVSAGVDR
jgi:predicted glycogen debranching enzyme